MAAANGEVRRQGFGLRGAIPAVPLAAPAKLHIGVTLDTGNSGIDKEAIEQVLGILWPLLRRKRYSKAASNKEQGRRSHVSLVYNSATIITIFSIASAYRSCYLRTSL